MTCTHIRADIAEKPVTYAERIAVRNYGTSGANTRESLARLPQVLAGRADHLVIFLGMNDAMNSAKLVGVKEYRKNLTAMTTIANKTQVRSILFLTIHPVIPEYLAQRHPRHPQLKRLQAHLAEYDAAVREVAKKTGTILVDWRARFLAESPGSSVEEAVANQKGCLLRCEANCQKRDGNHLTAVGYRLLADEVARALRGRVKAGDVIACFGDSLTLGSHMETYPAFLRSALRAEGIASSTSLYGPKPGRLAEIAPPGWEIDVKLPGGKHTRIASTAKGVTPKVTVDVESGETCFVWDSLGAGPLGQVTVRMTRHGRASGTAWRLDVENRGRAAVWNVTFPNLQVPVTKDDTAVIPSVSGRLHSVSLPLAYRGSYPSGILTMQCSGLYGPTGGIYAAVHDPYGSTKRLEMDIKNGRLDLRWQWPVPNMGVPGTGWKMPGELVIRPFDGDWFDVAQIYRAWAQEKAAWWPRGKQAGRPDTPDWFKDIAVWVQIGGPWPRNRPPIALDQVVPRVKRFVKYMGNIPCAVHWYNWHEIPFDDNYPHYFPAKKGFAEGVKELQEAGVRVMPYLNAHLWDTDLKDFKTIARPAAIKASDASLSTKSYNGNVFACMCPTTPLWQKTVKDLVQELAGPKYGVDGVYLDQVSAQAAMPCFDTTHGHPLGGGCWWTVQGYWPMLDEIRNSSPGTILTSESSAEPYVNRLDGYLTWVGYRDGSNAVPMFHAVYGGQVQLFGRLYKWDSWKGLAMRMKTAQALMWGEQLGWIRTDVIDDPVAGPFLKRLSRLRYVLRRYLSSGRMARPPAITTDSTTVTANWVFTRDLMVTTPTVLSAAWHRDDDKAVVLILVNVDNKPHTVELPFDASTYGLEGKLHLRQWTGTETGNTPPKARSIKASWKRRIVLAPLEALAIEIEAVLPKATDSRAAAPSNTTEPR